MLDFRIDTFLAVCECMNYTKAAEMLNVTQPAVSQHIRWLEQQYGVQLFVYEGKRLYLTPQGQMLKTAAITLKHDQLHLQRCLIESAQQLSNLNFGVTPTVGMYLLPKPLANYHKQFPDADVKVRMTNTHTLCKALDNGELDFAIVEGYFHKNDYDSLLYKTEPYLAVCAADYTFEKEPHCLSDLQKETLLVREVGSGNREILQRTLSRQNLSLDDFSCRMELGDMNLLKELLLEGCGIAFLYEAAVKRELQQGLVRQIHLEDFVESHDISFIWRKNSIFADRYQQLHQMLSPIEPSLP